MKTKSTLLWLAGLLTLAQIASAEDTRISTRMITPPGEATQLEITNHADQPIMAVVINWQGYPSPFDKYSMKGVVKYYDTEFAVLRRPGEIIPWEALSVDYLWPISPGDKRRLPALYCSETWTGDPAVEPRVFLQAAVFADGSFYGDERWARSTVERRKRSYRHVEAAIQKLTSALQSNGSREQLINDFTELLRRQSRSAEWVEENKQAAAVFSFVRWDLRESARYGAPLP